MTSLLHLDSSASPAGGSISRQLTARFAGSWLELHGPDGYTHRDLAADPVTPIGPAYTALGQRLEQRGVVPPAEVAALVEGPDEEREWALTRALIADLQAADVVLLGVPMYNFSIPASLKTWIDRITFPGAFTGELRSTRVVAVFTQGGGYGPGTPREGFDFQTPYLRAYFTNLGVTDENLHFVTAELTRAADVPELAPFQPLATASLAAAQTAMTTLPARLLDESRVSL